MGGAGMGGGGISASPLSSSPGVPGNSFLPSQSVAGVGTGGGGGSPYLWQQYFTSEGFPYYYNSISGHTQWERPIPPPSQLYDASGRGGGGGGGGGVVSSALMGNIPPSSRPTPPPPSSSSSSVQGMVVGGGGGGGGGISIGGGIGGSAALAAAAAAAGGLGRSYGPPGSNLFIFHLPSDWDDNQLTQHFQTFGNIVSARIQRDVSGRNSGFGFVSFDNNSAAIAAIRKMNGYNVGGKYLKVQLKKGEEHFLPPELRI